MIIYFRKKYHKNAFGQNISMHFYCCFEYSEVFFRSTASPCWLREINLTHDHKHAVRVHQINLAVGLPDPPSQTYSKILP